MIRTGVLLGITDGGTTGKDSDTRKDRKIR